MRNCENFTIHFTHVEMKKWIYVTHLLCIIRQTFTPSYWATCCACGPSPSCFGIRFGDASDYNKLHNILSLH